MSNWQFEERDYLSLTGELREHTGALPGMIPKSKTVVINTPGGANTSASPWYDWIRYHKLNTFAMGECSSYGFILFSAGEERGCFPSTVFMIHGPATEASKPPRDIIGEMFGRGPAPEVPDHHRKNLERMMEKYNVYVKKAWLDRMVQISNKDRSFWEEIASDPYKNHYFTAQELLEMGVVTKIYE